MATVIKCYTKTFVVIKVCYKYWIIYMCCWCI